MAERRRARRIAKRVPVRFGSGSFRNTGFTVDASSSGLFIATMQLPEVGALLDVELQVAPDFALQLHGFVVRHKVVPPALRTVAKGGFALRLLTPEEVHDLIVGRGEALSSRRPRALSASPGVPSASSPAGGPSLGGPARRMVPLGLPGGTSAEATPPQQRRLACRFSDAGELAQAWQTQIRHGGIFVRADEAYPRELQVIVEVQLGWLGQRLQFAARVVQVVSAPVPGVALLFQDATHARATLGRFLPAPETGGTLPPHG